MFRHRNRLIATAGAALATATLVGSGALAASATTHATAAATEHFQLVTTSTSSSHLTVIAWGAFTGHATDIQGNKADLFKFANGSFKVMHSKGKGKQSFNPRTCLMQINERGTFRVADGAGAYRGISGHGTYHLQIVGIGPKSGGKCSKRGKPVAFQQIIQATGTVSR